MGIGILIPRLIKQRRRKRIMINKQFTNELEAKSDSAKESVHAAEEQLKYLFTSSPGVIHCCKPSGDYGTTFISENITLQLGRNSTTG
jgi:hypothetical protein